VTASARQKLTNLTKESRHTISKRPLLPREREKAAATRGATILARSVRLFTPWSRILPTSISVGIVGIVAAPAG
jgi:hypothetical protein